jgi:Rieske Fe-S protein
MENNNSTRTIVLTAIISAVSAAALTAGIIFAVQNRHKIKAAAIRVKDKSVSVANNLKAKLKKKKNVDISLDETYDIPEELSFEESDADLEILTAED